MKSFWTWLLLVLVIGGGLLWLRHARSPDVQLAARLQLLCDLSERNVETPVRGVDELFSYFGEQTPALFSDFGRLLVEIERVDDDSRHDARAREAARRLRAPLRSCERSLQRFGEAIESNPAASQKLQRGAERFERTLQILFGDKAARTLSPRAWARPLDF
jgi:hypothetical protein